ncbi:MAG: tripartite tricarboxylate transporter TctB family protein [Sphingomonadaceae bacterium]
MRRIYQVASLVFLAMALYVVWEARTWDYMTPLGPGPGFFPIWMGLVLGGLAIGWLAQVSLRPADPFPAGFLPDRAGALRLVSIVAAMAVLCALMDTLGFQLTILAFMLFLLMALGRQNLLVTIVISLVSSFGTYYLFKTWLDVQLPASSIVFLRNLGL